MAINHAIRVLELQTGVDLERQLFRLQKGVKLRFTLSPLLQPYHGKLFCTHPDKGKKFRRGKYQELNWKTSSKCKCDDGDRFAEIETHISGSFHFYFQYSDDNGKKSKRVSGYFVVDPTLSLSDEEHLPLDCIALQTYLAKCLGPLSEWEARLRVAYRAGYNMIHLTPVQELGGSNSSYSLHDQLKLNSSFNEPNTKYDFDHLKKKIEKLHKHWKMFFICDIVLNHTANCTPWLRDHPESAYNLSNSPHLRPAYVVDDAIWKFSSDIARGVYDSQGLPVYITQEEELGNLHRILGEQILPALNLWEFYGVDVSKVVEDFKIALAQKANAVKNSQSDLRVVSPEIMLVQDPEYRRFGSNIDVKKAVLWYLSTRDSSLSEAEWINHCCSSLRVILESLNNKIIHEDIPVHIKIITHNIVSTVRYERLDVKGPHLGYFTKEHPLVNRYFIDLSDDDDEDFEESLMYTNRSKYIVAHPGWIMGGSALDDFAAPQSFAYLRREVIVWGDSVKLRYGQRPEDAPFLWAHMLEYVKLTASIFHGIRLDNCHSTPIHVAEYLIDAARQVRPDLYVIAELFTESEYTDNVFVNRLGLTSLIREAMSAHDSHEQGRLVYRYGGEPVGAFFHLSGKPMVNGIAHALYMDVTHDNPNPTEVRSVFDCFPTAALVNMACCATGSNRGNDEFVPHHINVVTDDRKYQSLKENDKPASADNSVSYLPLDSGMIFARRTLNELHRLLAKEQYNQVYVDQMSADIVAVTRHSPENHESVVLVAHTAFSQPAEDKVPTTDNKQIQTFGIKPLVVEGIIDEVLFEGRTLRKVDAEEYIKNPDFINGLETHVVEIREYLPVEQSQFVRVESQEGRREVYFESFPPGSVIAFKISLFPRVREAVKSVRDVISDFCESETSEYDSIFKTLNLADMNRILYRCDAEEKADGFGGGAYDIPSYGPFVYCGIQGFMSTMSSIRANNDLGHPICHNLRQGNWLMDYTAQRLMHFKRTKKFATWLQSVIDNISKLPRYLVPAYFDVFITVVYMRLLEHVTPQMSGFIQNGSAFIKSLAMGSVQLVGSTSSAPLPGLSLSLTSSNSSDDLPLTISAGLPHFSVGLWRSWGRDTFISIRGLLLVTGRFQEARELILAYGGCVRHGLIPNLLNGGTGARYNCRDASWWWLQAIQDYCRMVPCGHEILQCLVARMYPDDDSPLLKPGEVEQPLHDVVQEIMQRHFCGIEFRERNAGAHLDRNLRDEAFNVKIGVDRNTGFVFGGSQWNSGTWMDKNGESQTAGNAGIPATPRDGSSVEIVGLCKSTVRWLADISKRKIFPFDGVTADNTGETWSYTEWEKKIQAAFEEKFWISDNVNNEDEESSLVHKRGIYKDCYKATHRFTDYQFRPNFPMAMAVAPEMFNPKNAWTGLEMIRKHLLGPLGVRTLDPDDWAFDGVYDNSQDSSNYKNARGFNYHQGPEWLWVLGAYLRARLHFSKIIGGSRHFSTTCDEVKRILSTHHQYLLNSSWHGLPELTNVNGAYCKDSCEVQAWSMSCLLDVFYDMENMME